MKKLSPILLLIIYMCVSAACSRRVYVPVERVEIRSDTLRDLRLRTDSIVVRDSVFFAVRGDTVVRECWRWRERERILRDTVERVVYVDRKQVGERRPADTGAAAKARAAAVGAVIALAIVFILILLKR